MYIPVKFNAQIKDFRYFDKKFFEGLKETNLFDGMEIKHTLHIQEHKLINSTQRLIDFTFTVEYFPQAGKLEFDGECILESTNQENIEMLIQFSPSFKRKIEYTLTKNAYKHAEQIAKENKIYIFPSDVFLNEFKKDSEEFIKNFDEQARKTIEEQQEK